MEKLPPPGFRFYPTEEELITFYLHNKLHGLGPDPDPVIPSINIYTFEPPQLPGLAGRACEGETEQWFFFMPQQKRETRGGRPNRTTSSGYWKATGSPTFVYSQSQNNNKVIGVKKTMVFYKGKAPIGRKTKWKMNEYKAIKHDDNCDHSILNHNHNFCSTSLPPPPPSNTNSTSTIPELRHEFSLCRVYVTSGSARAFDRRPPARSSSSIMINNDQNATNNVNQGQRTTTSSQNNIDEATMLMERSSSTDSSNTGGNDDHHITLQNQEATNGSNNTDAHDQIEIPQALDSVWDWEQWFE